MLNLTRNEIKILNGMRTNNFEDCINGQPQWTFSVIDETDFSEKVARGVIASLVKKGLVTVDGTYGKHDEESTIGFTEAGIELFADADGKDCNWGGPKLLREPLPEKKTIKKESTEPTADPEEGRNATKKPESVRFGTVTVVAFTGMVLGDYGCTIKGNTITVATKSGILEFNKETLVQTNAKNPRYANRIVK